MYAIDRVHFHLPRVFSFSAAGIECYLVEQTSLLRESNPVSPKMPVSLCNRLTTLTGLFDMLYGLLIERRIPLLPRTMHPPVDSLSCFF